MRTERKYVGKKEIDYLEDIPEKLQRELNKFAKILAEKQVDSPNTADDLIKECVKAAIELKGLRKKSRRVLYDLMRSAMVLTTWAMSYQSVLKQVREAAKAAHIPETKGTTIALLVVKLCIGTKGATASQQAQAINGALLQRITADDLPKHLPGQGIIKLAEFYRAAKMGAKAANGNATARAEPRRPISVKFVFTDDARKQLDKAAKIETRKVVIFAHKAGKGGWEITDVKLRPNTEK